MSEALAGALAGGEQQQQEEQQQEQQQQATAFPDWMGDVPADLQTDDLKTRAARYATPLDMFKGLTETQDWARGRLLPPKDNDAQSYAEFAAKIRPEKAEDYKIAVPDGQDPQFSDAFRSFAFENGGEPVFVERLANWWNQTQADQASKQAQAGATEIKSIELEIGEAAYTQRIEAVTNMLTAAGVEIDAIAPALEKIGGGAGKALQALFTLAERTGELAKVDGEIVDLRMGSMTAAQAQEKIDAYGKDPAFMEKAKVKNSPEWKIRDDLNRRIARGDR